MKKYWRNYWYNIESICYEFSFGKINGLNQEEIKNIVDFFLKLGVKYRFFEHQILSKEEYVSSTLNMVEGAFSRVDEFIGRNTIRSFLFSSNDLGTQIPNLVINVPLPNKGKIEMEPLPIAMGDNGEVVRFDIYVEFDPKDHLVLAIASNSDIWWPDLLVIGLEGASRVGEYLTVPFDNRPFAYRMTPRLNSFLRDMKVFAADYEFRLGYEAPNEYCTRDGVLLDGKIIYQEDIDEGRVVPPDEYREMHPELIEKLEKYDLL